MESRAKPDNYMYNNVLQEIMPLLELELKKIGNSMGFVVPADIIAKEKLRLGKRYSVLVVVDAMAGVRAAFGSLPRTGDTDELLAEASDGERD